MRDVVEPFHQMADRPQGGVAEVFGRMWSVPVAVKREGGSPMHASSTSAYVAWVEECVGTLLTDLRLLTGQLYTLAVASPILPEASEQFRAQATLLQEECWWLRRQLGQLQERGRLDDGAALEALPLRPS
jgi:hypothetical protein